MNTTAKKYILSTVVFLIGIFSFSTIKAQQSNYYWAQNFNSVSSLLSGAVVAGGGGTSSIYYNPANISNVGINSNLSVSAVMFSWRYYKRDNFLGNGINLNNLEFFVQPRFITYVDRLPKSKFTLAGTVFTRIHERTEINYVGQQHIDILKSYPGDEQYNAYYNYRNRYNDTWVGLAASYTVSQKFYWGMSAFVSLVSRQYLQEIENSAVAMTDKDIFTAIYNSRVYVSYNNYRIIFKIGMAYKTNHWRFGINLSTPSFTVLSTDKKLLYTQNQDNITYQGKPLPDSTIFFSRQGNGVTSHVRLPFSVALGTVYLFPHSNSRLYFTIEHFFPLAPYLSLEAYPHPNSPGEWLIHRYLSVASGSKSLTNVAVGFRWKKNRNLGLMLGFRTDFNYLKNFNFGQYKGYKTLVNTLSDNYHFTGGAEFTVLGQKVISGVELTYSRSKNQKQVANFTNPVEYNAKDHIPLQGPLENKASIHYFAIKLYLSATLNFGGGKKLIKRTPLTKK